VAKLLNPKKLKTHPWRACPLGKHWVSKHPRTKSGRTREVAGHCRNNPSKKDQIYSEELSLIAQKYFNALTELPKADNLDFKYLGNRYDSIIAGWTKYWNEILLPDYPLDADLVKALIATESGFKKDAFVFAGKRAGQARGLMQVTDWSLEILCDENGELRDHLVNIDQGDLTNPVLNIAAGVRWLHRKRETASGKLKRSASWMEAAADYKSYLEPWLKNPKHTQMKKLIKYYDRLKK
jgi:hypothetical protein